MPKTRVKQDPVARDSVPPPKRSALPIPKGWKRAEEALDRVVAVSTIFPDFNRASRCGGLPVNRMHTIHGPTHGGKTAFVFGLMKSFLDGGHIAAYIDAEHATPQEFAAELIGDLKGHQNFYGKRPDTYEEAINAVNEFLKMMMTLRESNPELYCIIVIDSINKLQPARELKNVLKAGGDEVAKGHAGRYRAAVNQAWLNHLSPRLAAAGCAFVMIAQEREDSEGNVWDPEGQVSIKGGQALSFDSSMLMRVSKAMPVRDPSQKTEKQPKGPIVGFAHNVRIYKSKVSHMDGAYSDCLYHFSNGKQTPAGFDLGRDAVHVAQHLGIVTLAGSWLTWHKRRWQGQVKAAAWLAENPLALRELLQEIDAHLRTNKAA